MPFDVINKPEIIGENLKKLRLIHEKTLAEISLSCGLSKSFLSLVESGKRSINFFDLLRLLEIYNYSPALFVSEIAEDFIENSSIVQTKDMQLLLDGTSGENCYSIILTRPIKSSGDAQLLQLSLPPKSDLSKNFISYNFILRGIVTEGELLISFPKDEHKALKYEEFTIEAGQAHILRNFSENMLRVVLVINK